ncbi:hypothetical protein [Henriciella sp.]|uniref:hypothetical protein n=1 Tax=Henriciella sp. TaxID=1968823 RepID=UPI002619612B|nr:hypothetical protein [Henriciella sp.]
MSTDDALNLSDIDPPVWRVRVSGADYGPYTLGQMKTFVHEHRVSANSLVAEGETAPFLPAADHSPLRAMFETAGKSQEDAVAEPTNYLIIAKLAGTGQMQLIGALNRLGRFAEVMPGVWALRSKARQARVRDRLQATITSGDQVMIANATTGRLAWLNLGPEADVHIRRIWDAELDETA